jgi:hypothetical protein
LIGIGQQGFQRIEGNGTGWDGKEMERMARDGMGKWEGTYQDVGPRN